MPIPPRTSRARSRGAQPRVGAQPKRGAALHRRASGLRRSLAIIAAALACSPGQAPDASPQPEPRGRVLLIGVDGATLRVIEPMLRDGRLPNLARIAAEGVSGPLRSIHPMHSPRIWNSVSTGKMPRKHGIYTFVKKDEEGGKHLFTSEDRTAQALWNIASRAGIPVAVINWWTTYPPDVVDGVVVSDHFFPEQIEMLKRTFKDSGSDLGSLVYPEGWRAEAEAILASEERLTDYADPFADNDALPHWVNRQVLSDQFATDNAVARIAVAAETEFHPRLAMVFLPGVDRVSHWLWGNLEPDSTYPEPLRPEPAAKRAGAEALFAYYEYIDGLIGELVKPYGRDDLVMVISDHGFEAGVSLMLLTGNHETKGAENGILFARGPGIPGGLRNGPTTVLDITPTILRWLGLPTARDMDGAPAAFLELPRLEAIDSYEGPPIERLSTGRDGLDGELLEQLRGLGYLEERVDRAVPEHASEDGDEAGAGGGADVD